VDPRFFSLLESHSAVDKIEAISLLSYDSELKSDRDCLSIVIDYICDSNQLLQILSLEFVSEGKFATELLFQKLVRIFIYDI
jgi:hypothetical protein